MQVKNYKNLGGDCPDPCRLQSCPFRFYGCSKKPPPLCSGGG